MDILTLEHKILHKNDETAEENRRIFKEKCVFTVNIMSSPGSGKTSIIEKTLEQIKDKNVSVITGDVQTARDAIRIKRYGVPVVQLVTNGSCHLSSQMIKNAFISIDLDWTDILLIENIGNLVCPSSFDLGENSKVVLLSTTEGHDKPYKYPAMFLIAEAIIINKTDLLPYVDFDLNMTREYVRSINPSIEIFETSCTNNTGIEQWCNWLLMEKQPVLEST
ncbi:hydrogenase nickel incorporation protein HypB [candidate division KSB1 bacterium]